VIDFVDSKDNILIHYLWQRMQILNLMIKMKWG